MADMQHFDAGSILVALNLVSKCGVLYLQKNMLFFVGAGAIQMLLLV
jgi:hypothetical protein